MTGQLGKLGRVDRADRVVAAVRHDTLEVLVLGERLLHQLFQLGNFRLTRKDGDTQVERELARFGFDGVGLGQTVPDNYRVAGDNVFVVVKSHLLCSEGLFGQGFGFLNQPDCAGLSRTVRAYDRVVNTCAF
ncbi:hypothetical protein D3C80_1486400 [compost metagenome]